MLSSCSNIVSGTFEIKVLSACSSLASQAREFLVKSFLLCGIIALWKLFYFNSIMKYSCITGIATEIFFLLFSHFLSHSIYLLLLNNLWLFTHCTVFAAWYIFFNNLIAISVTQLTFLQYSRCNINRKGDEIIFNFYLFVFKILHNST